MLSPSAVLVVAGRHVDVIGLLRRNIGARQLCHQFLLHLEQHVLELRVRLKRHVSSHLCLDLLFHALCFLPLLDRVHRLLNMPLQLLNFNARLMNISFLIQGVYYE